MKAYMVDRVLSGAAYVIETGCTIRECAEKLGVSKTTVHKDLRERLAHLNPDMARAVAATLMFNLSDRHLRGGQATKRKYQNEKEFAACAPNTTP